ncbi:MAG: CaiB/BaiF CoA-transferase family protein, partial [Alphaproteobacteria bacterium]
FGQKGPRAGAAAYDPVIQAGSGMMTLTGYEGVTGPTKVGFWVCDMATGMTAAFAVSAAVAKQRGTGEGSYIDVSMLDVGVSLISPMVTNFLNFGVQPVLSGNGSPGGSSISSVYETADGYVQVAAATQGQFAALARTVGREDMLEDPRFADRTPRIANAADLRDELLKAFAKADARTWEKRLGAAGVPAGAVLTIPQVTEEAQILERGLIQSGPAPAGLPGEFRTVGAPFMTDGGRSAGLAPPPTLGEHTDAVLAEIGYDAARIAALKASRAIA